MTAAQDIRVWARDQGMDVPVKGPIPKNVMAEWEARQDASPAEGEVTGEVRPAGDGPESRPSMAGWAARRKLRRKEDKAPAPKRVSIESVVSGGWGIGAWLLSMQGPQTLPVARVLDMQAPVAGIVVNDVARGTILDRALQPLARMGEKGGQLGGLIGPPLIVGAITANPKLYPVLRPALKMSMMQWLEISAPAMKKAQERQARFADKFGDVDLDAMIDALFAPPEGYVPPEEDVPNAQEEENIRRARQAGGE